MQEMPVNVYYRWQKDANDDSFKRQNMYEKTLKETQWITWQEVKLGKRIFHRFNGDQVDLGCGGANGPFKKVPVDGFCAETNTVYQFYGCRWHGHGCHLDSGNDSKLLDYQTQRVHDYIISLGYKIEHVYECEFEKLMTDPTSDLCGFVRERYTLKFSGKSSATEQEILDAVKDGTFFGMCEVDIETPEELKDKFAEFQPIFKNKEVSRDDLTSDFLRQYAEDHGFLKRPQRMLLASYTGEKTLLITPLLKWYMEHGLVVKKLYQAFQAVGSAQFAEVGESVAQARRDADADPQQKMRSEMSKTVGNCFYGRAITDITRHREVTFCGEGDVEKLMRDPRFSDLEPIDDHTYEVEMLKKKFVFDLPFMLGLFVYQYAKLRMEAFFHDFIAKYIPRECFELCQMDTDSFYMALAGDTFDELVPEQLMDAYMKEKYNWLPREDTPENRAYDKRTPGLFKVEWQGDGLISLTSKLYYGWSATDGPKIACKVSLVNRKYAAAASGVRRLNECISKANYERTLQTGEIISGINDGFRMHGNVLKAYQQQKAAITGFYAKRPISADGVSTSACLL